MIILRRPKFIWISILLAAVALWSGATAWRAGQPSMTAEQTLSAFFDAWAIGDRKTALALLLRPDRLWHDFGRDIKWLRVVKIDRPFRADERQEEFRKSRGLSAVTILRVTFEVQFYRDGSMSSGRNVYSYFLVRKWPWSSWRLADWTSQP